ncbi:MAG TPA: hypothetical protein VHE30_17100 [Polyangiaceae bacterium]|nr:hypothetical protein [Polyangiaceae bacterium]
MDRPIPNPWQLMEPWRRVVLVAAAAIAALSYVSRHLFPSTDFASRVVVVVVGLAALLVWSKRPRPSFGEDEDEESSP